MRTETVKAGSLGFPVKSADLENAAVTLRSLGCRLLQDLLDGGRGLEVTEWFPGQEAAPFGRFRPWGFHRLRRILGTRLPWSPPQDTQGMLKIVPLRQAPERFSRILYDRLAWERHIHEGYTVPEGLWTLVGSAAWNAPDFHLQSARILTNHLRSRLMVAATDLPVPRLRPEALWLVIAAAPIRSILADWLPPRRRARMALAHFQPIARALALYGLRGEAGSPWSGDLWGQWIAWHIWRTRESRRLSSELIAAIEGLPLISGEHMARGEGWDRAPALARIYDKWYPIDGGDLAKTGRFRSWLQRAARLFKRLSTLAGQGVTRV
jgi:hypothetical protein